MSSIKQEIISKARRDLALRLAIQEDDISDVTVESAEFPDASLGASVEDEMSALVITQGWRIRLKAGGDTYEYRATERQLRLVNFKGRNYRA